MGALVQVHTTVLRRVIRSDYPAAPIWQSQDRNPLMAEFPSAA